MASRSDGAATRRYMACKDDTGSTYMKHLNTKNYFCGLGTYVVCLVPAMLPIFEPVLDLDGAVRLAMAAVLASVAVALMLFTRFDERIGDPGAAFTQSLLGMGICAGLYAVLAPLSQPQIMLMSLLWVAIGLTRLSPRQVAVLVAVYVGIYLNAYTYSLFDARETRHSDAIYTLLVSVTLCVFMYLRAHDYARAHDEKTQLHGENTRQAEALEEAKARIHAITVQDMDTIALKYPFYREELRRCKEGADRSGTTFSIGLIEVDHFSALNDRYGEMAMKQLLREVVERVSGILGKHGFEEEGDGGHHPLGRVGDGLYGMILPRANLKGAMTCAKQLHQLVELQSIRTLAGLLNVTLTIGIVEYFPGESLEELLETVGKSLEKARIHNAEELQAAARKKEQLAPVKAATGMHDLRLLHHKEYDAPVH
jgi:diguanylate cyclase (GGDEF)-like protein